MAKAKGRRAKNPRKKYSKPKVKKHENLKNITVLSVGPPAN
jgi:hypothetical protein